MTEHILDLHIHSRYSRACSKQLEIPAIAKTCETRGISIVSTGDFTHPAWFKHLEEQLTESEHGLYMLKDGSSSIRFLFGTEVAVIKKHKDKTRRVHQLIYAPNMETARKFNHVLEDRGFNIHSDGRPILGMTSKQLLEQILEIDERMVLIPAHAWTPWFGILGSKSGYDSFEEAFEELTPHVFALETGLSSDPLMNWQVSNLDTITLISNSDAHSLAKLGREANVMHIDDSILSYDEIMRIIKEGDREKFLYTIEFYPEEGKYHYDGHRACKFSCHPSKTKKYDGLCPICKKPLVIGVMNRVIELGDRTEENAKKCNRIPYKSLVPLVEIIANTVKHGWNTKGVKVIYDQLIEQIGTEFFILLHASLKKIEVASSKQIADAIQRVRDGRIHVVPGYDGEFGVVKVFADNEDRGGPEQRSLIIER